MDFGEFFKIIGIILLIIWIGPSLLCLAVGVLLCVCGFGEGGVAAGSLAAQWQSMIGNVVAGSLFAVFQSLGATLGVIAASGQILIAPVVFLFSPVGLAILAVAATVSGLVYYFCFSDSFETVKTAISDANITSNISESFENLKNTVSNANITSSIVNSFESVKTSISEVNISSKISDSFDTIKNKVSDANIPSSIADSFESAKASIENANITASIGKFFGNDFSDANIINLNRNLLCVETLLITCMTLFYFL